MINAPAVVLPVMPLIYHDGDSITLCNCRIKGATSITMQLSADYSELVGKRTSGRKIHSQRAIRVASDLWTLLTSMASTSLGRLLLNSEHCSNSSPNPKHGLLRFRVNSVSSPKETHAGVESCFSTAGAYARGFVGSETSNAGGRDWTGVNLH